MNMQATTPSTRRTALLLGCALVVASLTPAAHAGRKPNFGLYVQNYQKVVGTNLDFLIHPTGEYLDVGAHKWKQVRDLYTPEYRSTDNMDLSVMELREQGYVMIGYAAFNSSEARENPLDSAVEPGARTGTILGLKMRGIDPHAPMEGDPIHAAIWANAAVVVVQKGYAFSRLETKMARIQTDDGRESTRMSGTRYGAYGGSYAGRSGGSSTTDGRSDSSGDWDENRQSVGASADATGGSVSGEASQGEGSSSDKTKYGEKSNWNSNHSGAYAGRSGGGYDDRVQTTSQHWATALVDKHVNHYDYMATYWKKADVDKFVFGAFTESVPRDLMREIGTRHARRVNAVVGGTPAFDADVWEGDILLAIGGEPVRGEQGYSDLLTQHAGREVTMTLWREGEVFDLPVELNNPR